MDWNTFWEGGKTLNTLEVFFRVTLLYLTIFTMTRILGHRQVGIVSAFNFITHAGMAHVATSRMVNPKSSLVVAIVIILISYGLTLFLSWIDYKFPKLVGNSPIHLMENGILLRKNLKKAYITIDDLLGQLRLKEANSLSNVSEVVLEPMGEISVIKKGNALQIMRGQLKMSSQPTGVSLLMIYEGHIIRQHIEAMNLDESWLIHEIEKKGFNIKNVMVATLEPSGNIHVSVM
ncbi:DUF421 domain-containing protein [Vallitalea maricola]|uniref:Uncharacterized protein n=1 Tax=Vallitalea maricola TaxID=3074433 RepID=A0ACB5UQN1_9FIRM|nr:hypothetical protein AN2V17_40930 [Vallitalea sp. AN17-2]